MHTRLKKLILILALAVVSQHALAAEPIAPQTLVQTATNDVLKALKEGKAKLASDPKFLDTKVEELILPHLDFIAMSKLALGKHWNTATPAQQQAFAEQFKRLLVRTYKTSLAEYSSQTVDFLPFRASDQPDKLAVVRSEIKRAGGPPIPLVYSLRFKPEDGWKVYDIGIEGISLVTNYRSSFNRDVQAKGIDALIVSLKTRNEQPKAAK
jgi:phospholipid transport system substrate-binding protein